MMTDCIHDCNSDKSIKYNVIKVYSNPIVITIVMVIMFKQ